jgi:hypothetical protein
MRQFLMVAKARKRATGLTSSHDKNEVLPFAYLVNRVNPVIPFCTIRLL